MENREIVFYLWKHQELVTNKIDHMCSSKGIIPIANLVNIRKDY